MSKFAALAANVSAPFRVELLDPVTDEPIRDRSGAVAYIDVLSVDSDAGRAFDREERAKFRRQLMKSRSGQVDAPDQLEENIAKAAKLTKGWHLVDPVTREAIDVPFTEADAVELYSEPGSNWLFVQVWAAATNAANFMRRSPKA